ncbi:hypothetical protein [Streptomyces sp. NPDC001933]|uniref:hypothetical protein n=1 Tax=Streptomyces sp. NPDC001933 TaxID=3364626 RepID=UPI0036D0922E
MNRPPLQTGRELPLSGATLAGLELDLGCCRLAKADFTGTQFHGTMQLDDYPFHPRRTATPA